MKQRGRSSSHSGVQVACVTMGNNEYGTCVRQLESSTANLTAQRTSRNEIFNIMQFSIRLTRFRWSYKIATLSHSTPIRVPRRQLVNYASYWTPNWPKKTGPVGGLILDIIYHLTHPISQINTAIYFQIIQPLSFYENQDGILPEPESFNALLARRTSYNCPGKEHSPITQPKSIQIPSCHKSCSHEKGRDSSQRDLNPEN